MSDMRKEYDEAKVAKTPHFEKSLVADQIRMLKHLYQK